MRRQTGFKWALFCSVMIHIIAFLTVPIGGPIGRARDAAVRRVTETAVEFVTFVRPKPPPPPPRPRVRQRPPQTTVRRVVRRRRPRRRSQPAPRHIEPPVEEQPPEVTEPEPIPEPEPEVKPAPEPEPTPELAVLPPEPEPEPEPVAAPAPEPEPVVIHPPPPPEETRVALEEAPTPTTTAPAPEKSTPELVAAAPAPAVEMPLGESPTEASAPLPLVAEGAGGGRAPGPERPGPPVIALAPQPGAGDTEAPGAAGAGEVATGEKAVPEMTHAPTIVVAGAASSAAVTATEGAVEGPVAVAVRPATGAGARSPAPPVAGQIERAPVPVVADAPPGPRGTGGGDVGGTKSRPTRVASSPTSGGEGSPAAAGGESAPLGEGEGEGAPVRIASNPRGETLIYIGAESRGDGSGRGEEPGAGGGPIGGATGEGAPGGAGGGPGELGVKAVPEGGAAGGVGPGGTEGGGGTIEGGEQGGGLGGEGLAGAEGPGGGPIGVARAPGAIIGGFGISPAGGESSREEGGGLFAGGGGSRGEGAGPGPGSGAGAYLIVKAAPTAGWRPVAIGPGIGGIGPGGGQGGRGGMGTGEGTGIGADRGPGIGPLGPIALGTSETMTSGPALLALPGDSITALPGLFGGGAPGEGMGGGPGESFKLFPMMTPSGVPAGIGIGPGAGGLALIPEAGGWGEGEGGGPVMTGLPTAGGHGGLGLLPLPEGMTGDLLARAPDTLPGLSGLGAWLDALKGKSTPGGLYSDVSGAFDLPMGITTADYQADAEGMVNLLAEVRRRTSIRVTVQQHYVPLTLENIRNYPVLHLRGHRPFTFTEEEREVLRQYVAQGGTIFGEDSHGPFGECFRREMRKIFGRGLEDLPPDHELYRAHYVLDRVPAGDMGERYPLQGIDVGGRLGVIFSRNDYGDCWEGTGEWVRPESREPAFQIGVNIFTYITAQWQRYHGR